MITIDELTVGPAREDDEALLAIIEEQIESCKEAGDHLGAGEWYAAKARRAGSEVLEESFVAQISLWGSRLHRVLPKTVDELMKVIGEFDPDRAAVTSTDA